MCRERCHQQQHMVTTGSGSSGSVFDVLGMNALCVFRRLRDTLGVLLTSRQIVLLALHVRIKKKKHFHHMC